MRTQREWAQSRQPQIWVTQLRDLPEQLLQSQRRGGSQFRGRGLRRGRGSRRDGRGNRSGRQRAHCDRASPRHADVCLHRQPANIQLSEPACRDTATQFTDPLYQTPVVLNTTECEGRQGCACLPGFSGVDCEFSSGVAVCGNGVREAGEECDALWTGAAVASSARSSLRPTVLEEPHLFGTAHPEGDVQILVFCECENLGSRGKQPQRHLRFRCRRRR